jgi:hypothetical protein
VEWRQGIQKFTEKTGARGKEGETA